MKPSRPRAAISIEELQGLIDEHKLNNAHQLIGRPEVTGRIAESYVQKLFTSGKLKRHPEGEQRFRPPELATPEKLASIQEAIDRGNVTSVYQVARLPEARPFSDRTIYSFVGAGRLKLVPKVAASDMTLMSSLRQPFSEEELRFMVKSGGRMRVTLNQEPIPTVNFTGEHVCFVNISDMHAGSIYFHEKHWDALVKVVNELKPEFIACDGDITNGLKHALADELTHGTFDTQAEYAEEQMARIKCPWFFVSGNHDRWPLREVGADICKAIDKGLKARGIESHYLGHDEGDVSLRGMATLRLWHGEDSSSYAISYRIQKITESFTGGEKPNILTLGHTHKSMYMQDRHVHCVSSGAMCTQSRWMRSKRLANHSGFWIIDAWVNKSGVCRFRSEWRPFYA